MIEVITNSGIKYDESKEAAVVCQAIQEIRKESESKGRLMQAQESAKKLYKMEIDTKKIAQASKSSRYLFPSLQASKSSGISLSKLTGIENVVREEPGHKGLPL